MRTTVVTTLDHLSDYEERWEGLRRECAGTIFSSYALARTWLEAYEQIASPYLIMVEDGRDLVGIAPFSVQLSSFGGLTIRMLSLVGDADMRLGLNPLRLLIQPGCSEAVEAMVTSLKGSRWNLMRTQFMEDVSDNQRFLDLARSNWSCDPQRPSTTITCSLPRSGDAIELFGKKTRAKIRHQLRDIEGRHTFRSLSPDQIEQAVRVHAQQHIARWEIKGGSIFLDPTNVRFLGMAMTEGTRKGFGLAYELMVDGEVAAQQFNLLEDGMAHGYRAGMNNAFADISPGWSLNYYALEDMMRKGALAINLGEGGEDYKRHMGGVEASLIGLRARRGGMSLLVGIANSAPVMALDNKLGIRKRMLRTTSN